MYRVSRIKRRVMADGVICAPEVVTGRIRLGDLGPERVDTRFRRGFGNKLGCCTGATNITERYEQARTSMTALSGQLGIRLCQRVN